VGPRIEPEDRASVLRVARYGARAPVAESRLRYDAERAEVELVSDASEGPYAGVHRFAALEFLARLVDHIPAKGEVRVRYYGAYASRRWGWWRRRGVVLAGARPEDAHDTQHEAEPWPALQAGRRRCGGCSQWTSKCARAAAARCGTWRLSPSRRWSGGSSRISSGAGSMGGPDRGRGRRRAWADGQRSESQL
jgi:hypothetical protein